MQLFDDYTPEQTLTAEPTLAPPVEVTPPSSSAGEPLEELFRATPVTPPRKRHRFGWLRSRLCLLLLKVQFSNRHTACRDEASKSPHSLPRPPSSAMRRRFMSGKAAEVHEEQPEAQNSSIKRQLERQPGSNFATMRQEVLNYGGAFCASLDGLKARKTISTLVAAGAAGLSGKQQKALEAQRLEALGARPEKGPRIPASIGKGAQRLCCKMTLSPCTSWCHILDAATYLMLKG